MKEYIVDFELYKDGRAIEWLQQSFQLSMDEPEEGSSCAFEFFRKYAAKYWQTENTCLNIRIKNIWKVEVE